MAGLREQVAIIGADTTAARMLAAGADHDVSEVRAELRAHTRGLSALRETQLEQGRAIAELRTEVHGIHQRLGGVEHRLDGLEREMREGFAVLGTGMAQITALLTNLERQQGEGS